MYRSIGFGILPLINKNSLVVRDEGLLRGTTLVALPFYLFGATSVDAVTGIPVRG